MSANTKIEWADHTFNPWIGCTKVSPACDHCYAEADFDHRRHVVSWGPKQPRKRTAASTWAAPLRWNRKAERLGIRYRVFCASLADVFDNEVPLAWRRDLFDLIYSTPNLDWLVLTKRVGNVTVMLNGTGWGEVAPFPWPNLWIGATICNQEEADRDIPKLLAVPAAKRFLSMEPLLGPVDLRLPTRTGENSRGDVTCNHCCNGDRCDDPTHFSRGRPDYAPHCRCPHCRGTGNGKPIDWVIVGGESGPNARPMHPDWARSLRDQCAAAGVPFLFKQWGEWGPDWEGAETCNACGRTKFDAINSRGECSHCGIDVWNPAAQPLDGLRRVGKKAAGRLLDGRTWDEVPA